MTGTPTALAFDRATRAFDLSYDTAGPGGRRYGHGLVTVVSVPASRYPEGYRAEVTGATVTSRPCAERLTLRTQGRADEVAVHLVPDAAACD